jgi:hypothetical protein
VIHIVINTKRSTESKAGNAAGEVSRLQQIAGFCGRQLVCGRAPLTFVDSRLQAQIRGKTTTQTSKSKKLTSKAHQINVQLRVMERLNGREQFGIHSDQGHPGR